MKPPLPGFTKITRPKASHVEEDQDSAEDTLALLHQAGDRDNAACLIAAHASDLVISDRLHILEGWIHRLPDRLWHAPRSSNCLAPRCDTASRSNMCSA